MSTPLIIYHRGRHGADIGIKENTLDAFDRAIKEGARMIEFDVWGDLRVAHGPGPHFDAPTLNEVLDVIRGRAAINIELKSPRALPKLAAALSWATTFGHFGVNDIVLSSFHHETAFEAKRLYPRLRVGVINDGVLPSWFIGRLAVRGINNLHIDWMNMYMDLEGGYAMREAAMRFHMGIWVYTVNTRKVFHDVSCYGASAVFTDRPDLLK